MSTKAGSTAPPPGGLGSGGRTSGEVPIGLFTAPASRRASPWVTGLLVAVGILGALGVGGSCAMRRYIHRAQTAEARVELSKIAMRAIAAYERDGRICPSASRPVPSNSSESIKYQSWKPDWEVDRERNAGFWCLGYERLGIQHFQYAYDATPTTFTARARGVVGNDGVVEELVATGELRDGRLVVHTP